MVNQKNTAIQRSSQNVFGSNRTKRAITSNTAYDFRGKQMTAFGGSFLVGSLIERLDIIGLINERLTSRRKTHMPASKLIVAIVILVMLGFERLQHIVHLSRDSIILRILGVDKLPVQSTMWRFLNRSLCKHNERQLQGILHEVRHRVWKLANIKPAKIHIDTDTTSTIAYGNQDGAKVGYCPGKRGAKCFRPLLSSISETGEIVLAQQRRGDRVSGIELAKHLKRCIDHTPSFVERIWRADSEFYCKESILVCRTADVRFIVSARKTAPVMDHIRNAVWKKAKVCDGVSEFIYQPGGWKESFRFVVARYEKKPDEQTDLFEDTKYKYRVFVTDLKSSAQDIVKEYDGRAGIENLIEEAKNQVAFAKIPGKNFIATSIFLQFVTMAFNLNRYLQLFGRDNNKEYHNCEMKTVRQTGLFISAKISDHAKQTIIHFGSEYPRRSWIDTIMKRLRRIDIKRFGLQPVIPVPLAGVTCGA
jgi:hypothetical protein